MSPPVDFFVRFLCFVLVHSALASNRLKQKLFHDPLAAPPWYRLFYTLLSFPLFFWVMTAWPGPPVLYVLPGNVYLLFRGMQLIILIAAFRCLQQTGLGSFLGFSAPEGVTALVTAGCYARVRHPLYTLGILFMLLEPAPSLKWLLLALMTGIYCLVAARWEEERLLEQHGSAYMRYRQSVPAFLPRFRLRKN